MAATRAATAAGYRMTMNIRFSAPSLPGPLTATLNGAFNPRDKSGTFALAYDLGSADPQVVQVLGSSTLHAQAVLKWPVAYYKFPAAITRGLGASKPWVKVDLTKLGATAGGPALSSLTNNPYSDPSRIFQYLRAVSGTITTVGKAHIGRIETTQYRATVDLNKLPDMVPESARSAARQTVAAMSKMLGKSTLPVDVWIDGRQRVRQMRMSLEFSANGQSGTLTTTADFPEYGPQPPAVLPPVDQVSTTTLGSGVNPQSDQGNVTMLSSPREPMLSAGTVTSLNWSGYMVSSSRHTITAVSGSVIVPPARPNAGGAASIWVGIGGSHTRQLIQAGVGEGPPSRGVTRRYFAWYELLPRYATVIPGHPVRPGELIDVTITRAGHERWRITLVDVHHWRWAEQVSYGSSNDSAEWILEAPTINGSVTELAHVGVVHFGAGDAFTAGGQRRTLGRGHAARILLISRSGRREATPSLLADVGRFNDCSYRSRCGSP